jgi:phosphate transport system protein
VIRILARQSPVARDLRILVSALRMSASLERMGALAGHIAAIARYPLSGLSGIRHHFVRRSKKWVA